MVRGLLEQESNGANEPRNVACGLENISALAPAQSNHFKVFWGRECKESDLPLVSAPRLASCRPDGLMICGSVSDPGKDTGMLPKPVSEEALDLE